MLASTDRATGLFGFTNTLRAYPVNADTHYL